MNHEVIKDYKDPKFYTRDNLNYFLSNKDKNKSTFIQILSSLSKENKTLYLVYIHMWNDRLFPFNGNILFLARQLDKYLEELKFKRVIEDIKAIEASRIPV